MISWFILYCLLNYLVKIILLVVLYLRKVFKCVWYSFKLWFLKMVGDQLLTPNNLALSKPILFLFKAVVIVWSNLLIHKWDYKINPWIQTLHGQKSLVKMSTKIKRWWENKAKFSYMRLGRYQSRLELKPPLQNRNDY